LGRVAAQSTWLPSLSGSIDATLPRLSFKRNQPKPEISRNLVIGFSRDGYIAPMLSSGHIAARGQPIALILTLAFDALQSPRQGTLCGSVWRRHGCLVSA
jgi:hypothetical protein